MGFLLFF